jgi:hypothetical protein
VWCGVVAHSDGATGSAPANTHTASQAHTDRRTPQVDHAAAYPSMIYCNTCTHPHPHPRLTHTRTSHCLETEWEGASEPGARMGPRYSP